MVLRTINQAWGEGCMDQICFYSLRKLSKAIQNRELSAREVMQAHLEQIEKVNPSVNAIVSLDEESTKRGGQSRLYACFRRKNRPFSWTPDRD